MFCRNCGKNLEQGELFCSACGTKVEAQPAQPVEPTYTAPIEPTHTAPTPVEPAYAAPVAQAPTKGGNKKLFIILGIVGAAVLVLVIAAYFIIGAISNTPENVAEDFVTAYCEYDAEGIVDCMPDFMISKVAVGSYGVASTREALINAYDLGVSPKSIQVISAIRDYEYTYADFLDDDPYDTIENYGGTKADVAMITDVCVVELNCFVDGDPKTFEVLCMEYDGDWYAIDLD